jgi:endonuclease G
MAEKCNGSERKLPTPRSYATFPFSGKSEHASLREHQEWKDLVETLHAHRRRLLRIPGVTAVDIGYKLKEKENLFEDKLALRVHVDRKLPEECFKRRQHDFIDPEKFPSPSGKIVTMDVIEADYRLSHLTQTTRPQVAFEKTQELKKVNRRRRIDPLVGGISIGSPQVPVGTLGALVWDREDGSVCVLSNWHVLAGDPRAEVGNPCFQPGLFDQGRSSDVVARLKRWSFDRQTDAAIAELTGSRRYSTGEILSMYQTIKQTAAPHLGMKVKKSGRSTGCTSGFVDGLYFSTAIEYSNGFVQVFEDQVHIAPLEPDQQISEPGDSGSVWVTDDPEEEGYFAVGLHFAGDLPRSAFGEYALANPMSIVEKRLNISFRPLFLEMRDEEMMAPFASQAMQIPFGNGSQPKGISVNGLTGPGIQPDQVPVGGGG